MTEEDRIVRYGLEQAQILRTQNLRMSEVTKQALRLVIRETVRWCHGRDIDDIYYAFREAFE